MLRTHFILFMLATMFAYSCQSDPKTETAAAEHSENIAVTAEKRSQEKTAESSVRTYTETKEKINSGQGHDQGQSQEANFLKVTTSGKSDTFSSKNISYNSDAKTGETSFTISGQKVVFPDLMKNVRLRGRDSLIDKEFSMMLPGISGSSELTARITKMGAKVPTGTSGYNQAIEGVFTGKAEGSFRLESFTQK